MNVTTLRTKAEGQLREQFDAAAAGLPGSGWVSTLRARAMDSFTSHGLPSRRVEEWKYTDLRERLRDVPAPGAVHVAIAGGGDHSIALTQGTGGAVSVAAAPASWPFALEAFPNPFVAGTTFRFALPSGGRADLRVYDVAGREVRALVDGMLAGPGTHTILWDGRDGDGRPSPPGVYFLRLHTGREALSGRVIRLR